MAVIPGHYMSETAVVAIDSYSPAGLYAYYIAEDDAGFNEGYAQGLIDGVPLPPTVAIVSPDPSVPAGDPGGFPDDETAFTTPIVLEVVAPDGIQLAAIALRYKDEIDIERVVYRRGAFRRGFTAASFLEVVSATVFRFHCIPDTAWRASSTNILDDIAFDVDVAGGDPALSLSPIGASS